MATESMIDQTGGPYKKLTRKNRTNVNKIIFNDSNVISGQDRCADYYFLAV
jgi:hypothetical protein